MQRERESHIYIYIYIYTYTYKPMRSAAGGSGWRHRGSFFGCCFVLISPKLRSAPMLMGPIEKLPSHDGKLGHYAPSSSGHLFRP